MEAGQSGSGGVAESATNAATALTDAANGFVDEVQALANEGVDLGQEMASKLIHEAIAAIETALAGVKRLAGHA